MYSLIAGYASGNGRKALRTSIRGTLRSIAAVTFIISVCTSALHAQAKHQFQWVGPVAIKDYNLDGVELQYRKGDNDVRERGSIFLKAHNRYKVRVIIEYRFDIVDAGTGGTVTRNSNAELGPLATSEQEGDFHGVPDTKDDRYLGPKAWSTARFTLCNAVVTEMRMATSADPSGQTYEVYPTNELQKKLQQQADEEAKAKQEEQRKEQERKQREADRSAEEARRQYEERQSKYEQDQKRRYDEQLAAWKSKQAEERNRQEQAKNQAKRNFEATMARNKAVLDGINALADYLLTTNNIKSERDSQVSKLTLLDLSEGSKDSEVLRLESEIKSSMKEEITQRAEARLKELDAEIARQRAEQAKNGGFVNPFLQSPDSLEFEARQAQAKADAANTTTERLMDDLCEARIKAQEREQEERLKADMDAKRKEWEAQEMDRMLRENPELAARLKAEAEKRAREKAEAERKQREAELRAAQTKQLAGMRFDIGELAKSSIAQSRNAFAADPLTAAAAKSTLANDHAAALDALNKYHEANPSDDTFEPSRALAMVAGGGIDTGMALMKKLRASDNPAAAQTARELYTRLQTMGAQAPPNAQAMGSGEDGRRKAQSEDWTASADAYAKAASLDPTEARWHSGLATALAKQNKWPEAATAYTAAAKLEPSGETLSNLGACCLQAKQWNEGVAAYLEAVKLEPTNAAYFDNLGTAYWCAGKLAEAIRSYEEAARLSPSDTKIQEHLSKAKAAQTK